MNPLCEMAEWDQPTSRTLPVCARDASQRRAPDPPVQLLSCARRTTCTRWKSALSCCGWGSAAQLVEQTTENRWVGGSNPPFATTRSNQVRFQVFGPPV